MEHLKFQQAKRVMILAFLFLDFGCFSITLADEIEINDCGSKNVTVLEVRVTDSKKTDKYCYLKHKTNATINIVFEANNDSKKLQVVLHGILASAPIPIPFPTPNPDGCNNSGIECPIISGNTYNFTATIPILPLYPKVTVEIKFELQSDELHVCVSIPAKIK